jgi:predicted phosphodiesterase
VLFRSVKFINDFEKTTANIAIENNYDYVLCGHIHHPEMKTIQTDKGKVEYLNSGDWIENLTALEYTNGEWKMFHYNDKDFEQVENEVEDELVMMSDDEIFNQMLGDFKILTTTKEIKFK